MANWYIGIDEHGNFNPSEPENDSFVCAVVTQESGEGIFSAFKNVFRSALGKDFLEKKELLKAFHGIQQKPEIKELLLRMLWHDSPDLIKNIYVTEGRPYVVSNAQQWWLMGVQSLLFQMLKSNLFADDDCVNVFIATRSLESIGFYSPTMVQKAKKEGDEEYLKLHRSYHTFLEHEIKSWLKSICKIKVSVCCESASVSTPVALADQAVNMAHPSFKNDLPQGVLQTVPCLNFLPEQQPASLLQVGDVLGATYAFLDGFFDKQNESFKEVVCDIFGAVDGKHDAEIRETVWNLLIEACDKALMQRGADGKIVHRVLLLKPMLEKEIETRGLPSSLQSAYFKLLSALYAHSGSINLDEFDRMEKAIVASNDFSNPHERWNSYLELQLFKAQSFFNGYNFNVDFLDGLLETQKNVANLQNAKMGLMENSVDDCCAKLLGTLGQAAAFKGEYEKALKYFEEDYNCTSDPWKSQVASYIVVVYHRLENWDKACEWFEKQSGMNFEQFGNTFDVSSNMWLVLNYLRLYALGLKLGKTLPPFPDKDKLRFSGDYPYGLIQKWVGICLYFMKDSSRVDGLLKASCKSLRSCDSYAINSLALPVLKMRYRMAGYDDADKKANRYKDLLEKCRESEGFVSYMADKSEFELDDGKFDIWKTAMMLPFNYA